LKSIPEFSTKSNKGDCESFCLVQETNKQKLKKENKRALEKILFIVKNCHEYWDEALTGWIKLQKATIK
jgi:hypothetical protein